MRDNRYSRFRGIARLKVLATSLLVAALSVSLSGCAIAVTGGVQTVPVTTAPEGAEVFIDGEFQGVTPLELELERGREYEVRLRFDGQERVIVLGNALDGTFVALDVAPAVVTGIATVSLCIAASQVGASQGDTFPIGELFMGAFCLAGAGATLIAGTPIYVDAATGAWNALTPSEVHVEFE